MTKDRQDIKGTELHHRKYRTIYHPNKHEMTTRTRRTIVNGKVQTKLRMLFPRPDQSHVIIALAIHNAPPHNKRNKRAMAERIFHARLIRCAHKDVAIIITDGREASLVARQMRGLRLHQHIPPASHFGTPLVPTTKCVASHHSQRHDAPPYPPW